MKCEICNKKIEGIIAHYQTKRICQECWRRLRYNQDLKYKLNWYTKND